MEQLHLLALLLAFRAVLVEHLYACDALWHVHCVLALWIAGTGHKEIAVGLC